ncbi:MAG TPA: HD domain-containing protein, partial [Bacteroidales bacterium]|nr:HD domain-containing protein [Bacteroidales bacterium]
MTRSEAFELLTNHVASEKMHFHCLASAAVMEALAIKLNQNADDWYLAGLLHDLDVEITRDTPSTHGLITVDLLKDKGLNEDILHAIEAHNEIASRFPRTSLFDHGLAAGE